MAQIKGPDGRVADVDLDNRLTVFAVIQDEDRHANMDGRYWSLFFQVDPTGVNDNFFYFKNTGTKDLLITDVRVSSDAVTQLIYKRVAGTPVGGTPIVPVNRKLADPSVPAAVFQQGVDITGLTDAGVIFFESCDVINRLQHLKTTSAIIIPQGQAVAFERIEATGSITCVVSVSESEF